MLLSRNTVSEVLLVISFLVSASALGQSPGNGAQSPPHRLKANLRAARTRINRWLCL